jgi:hypothetical protein
MNFGFDSESFNSRGIPSFTIWSGDGRLRGKSQEETAAIHSAIVRDHHGPDEEVTPAWIYDGVPQHVELYFRIALRYLEAKEAPSLLPDGPFAPVITLNKKEAP